MYNQQGFQGGQSSFAQGNRYQPAGFAQSQFGGFQNQNQNSQPVISHIGAQAGAQSGSFNPGYNTQSQSGDRANFGPVISHLGYEAGQDFNSGFGGGYQQAQSFAPQSSGFGAASFQGGFAGQSSNQQSQPVISRLGYQSSGQGRPVIQAVGGSSINSGYPSGGFQQSGMSAGMSGMSMGMGSQAFSGGIAQGGQVRAQTPENPVYRATQSHRNEGGPVTQVLGYQAGNDTSYQGGFQGGFQSGFQGGYQGR